MEKMHALRSQHSVNTWKNKIEYMISNNLKIQEGDILKKIYYLKSNDYDINVLRKIFTDYDVSFVDVDVKEPVSFYESKNANLYSVTIIPFRQYNKSVKLSRNVDLDLIRPSGPFNLKVEFFDNNLKNIKTIVIRDPLLPKTHSFVDEYLKKMFESASLPVQNNVIEIKNDDGKVISEITINMHPIFYRARIDSMVISLMILLVGIISSFIVGLIIKRIFVLPVMALSNAAKEIKKGNFVFRLDTNNKYELIRNIYKSFNDMTENLEAKEKLRQSFISNLTHDLRTPLVSQSQSLEMISNKFNEIGLKDEYELSISLARNNEHLLKMVNLILESYSFDSKKLKLNKEKVDLFKIVEDCKEKLTPLIKEKNLNFVNDMYPSGVFVNADFFQLTRVFMNLFTNAIENTNKNCYIKVYSHLENDCISITIEDNGNGISKDDLKFIFDRYYSGKSLERKLGAGFGLSVCKELVHMHNGKIFAESEVNKYTKFVIKLPVGL